MENRKQKARIDMLHGPIWNKLILYALPLSVTAVLIFCVLMKYRPAHKLQRPETDNR